MRKFGDLGMRGFVDLGVWGFVDVSNVFSTKKKDFSR